MAISAAPSAARIFISCWQEESAYAAGWLFNIDRCRRVSSEGDAVLDHRVGDGGEFRPYHPAHSGYPP